MAGGAALNVGHYSPLTGFVFIFNLIVGAGALTIPHAFAQVGLVYGTLVLAVLAMTSYITATFMVEAIAGVNALKKRVHEMETVATKREQLKHMEALSASSNDPDSDHIGQEFIPLMVPREDDDKLEKQMRAKAFELVFDFDLARKMELAEMAHMLFGKRGILAFYMCVTVYLFGDLAIYAVAVPKSLREIVCPRPAASLEVWNCGDNFNSSQLYKLFVLVFGIVLGPFAFGNVQKTRTLQFVTTVVRHASFALMILLACIGIVRGEGREPAEVIAYEKPANISTFFGVCIYSFMCHHSIPGLVAPITNKRRVGRVIAGAFTAVFFVYVILSFSATFRFHPEEIDDVYTLNFKKYSIRSVAYFLSLFPVCTLSANFPLICITLRENLRTLLGQGQTSGSGHRGPVASFLSQHVYALLAIVPPLLVAFFTEDVSMLVGFTGAYAGLGIQWVVPACLVYCLRRRIASETSALGDRMRRKPRNPFGSPFASPFWLFLTLSMASISVVLITLSHLK